MRAHRTHCGQSSSGSGSPRSLRIERLEDRRLLAVSPAGPEFRVNTTTGSHQVAPVVASTDDGRAVVVWLKDAGLPEQGIFGQLYNADGSTAGEELSIDTMTEDLDLNLDPSAAMDDDGHFVVVWGRQESFEGLGIWARCYANSGEPREAEFRVDEATAVVKSFPDVASDAEGNFVVVWQSDGQDGSSSGVYGRRFNRDGFPLDGEFRVNTTTAGAQGSPAVASDADGDFVVVWQSDGTDGDSYGVYGQRYARDGAPQGGEFLVNTATAGIQSAPDVAVDDDGNFVVVWSSSRSDGALGEIFTRLFDSTGLALGGAIVVNQVTANFQTEPTVARSADGGFVVAWTSAIRDLDADGVYGRSFDSTGAPTSDDFRINETHEGNQSAASLAFDGEGDLFAAWQSAGQERSVYHIYARSFAVGAPPPPPVPLTRSTAGLYDAANGAFFLRTFNSGGVADITFNYGAAGAGLTAVAGDFNGDDVDTVGLYNPATGGFFLRDMNAGGPADYTSRFGAGGPNYMPLVGDWDGDGDDAAGLYESTSGAFFLKYAISDGPADLAFNFGPATAGLVPLAGDWDGDGDDTIGLYDPTTGVFFLKNTHAAGAADLTFNFGPGGPDVTSLVGDWDADGDDTPGILRKPSSVFFLRNAHAPGAADVAFNFGPSRSGWQPIVGDFNGASAPALRLSGSAVHRSVPSITDAIARPLLDEARARWAAADFNNARRAGGVSPLFPVSSQFPPPTLRIADLPGNLLGLAAGNEILIDHNAAGRGWFVDPTPAADEEFQSINGRLLASDSVFAAESIDLLTVIAHELGHLLGNDHAHDGLMADTLAPGERRVPNR